MKKLLFVLLFLVACGKDASMVEAEKDFLDHKRPQSLSAEIKLNEKAHEIIILAFPEQSEVADYSYELSTDKNFGSLKNLFNLIPQGKHFLNDITGDMTPSEKVQGLVGKIITISDARDEARRTSYNLRKKVPATISEDIQDINSKLNEVPCYKVIQEGHKHFDKCYQEPVEDVTTSKPKRKWRNNTCKGAISSIYDYSKDVWEIGGNTSSSLEEVNEKISDKRMEEIVEKISSTLELLDISKEDFEKLLICKMDLKKADELEAYSAEVKLVVSSLLEEKIFPKTDKLVFLPACELDQNSWDKEKTIIFNPKTLAFEKFSVAINFNDEKGYVNYGPEYGNMTQPVVTEINGSGFYRVDFEIQTPKFSLKTLGLSLTIDQIFGLRISGKTRIEYPDGRSRMGIMRIDISPKLEETEEE